jgi:hypothetical protein
MKIVLFAHACSTIFFEMMRGGFCSEKIVTLFSIFEQLGFEPVFALTEF